MDHPLASQRSDSAERARLAAVDSYAVHTEPPNAVYDDLATIAAGICDTPYAMLTIVGAEVAWVVGTHGAPRRHAERGSSFCNHTVAQRRTLVVADVATDPRFDNLAMAGQPQLRFYAGTPLYSKDGEALGTICVLDKVPRELTAAQILGLEALASVAAKAIHASADASNTQRSYRDLLDTTPTGILVLEGTTILFANCSVARMLGEPGPAVLLGTDLSDRRMGQLPAIDDSPDAQLFWRLERADGSELAAEVSRTPIIWGGRAAAHVELRDVTAAVEAYGELADSELRYRQLADNSTDMIAVQTEHGDCRFVSQGSLGLTGYSPGEFAARSILSMIHPDDLVGYLDSQIQARAAGVDRFTVTYRLRHRDDTWIPVESTVHLIRNHEGAVVESQTNTRDITERVLVEQSRERADRQFRVAMDNAPIGMALLAPDGTLTEVNRSLCQLFDVEEADLIGATLDEFVHPDDAAAADSQLDRLLAGDDTSLEHELRYQRADGEYVWTLRTASVVQDPHDSGAATYLIVQIQDITAWKTIEETLSRQALSDPLTGLANRLMLTQRLTHALVAAKRRRTAVGLVFIDLDRFKAINDSLGHEAGDSILKQVAERLTRCIREEDTAVRLGGDEFVVLCEDLGGLADLRLVAGRIDGALSEPYRIDGRTVPMTASIGLSVSSDDDAESLLRHSDAAMYEAKRRGRGRTEIYDAVRGPDLDAFTIEEQLRSALQRRELRVFYQPVVSIVDGRTLAHEALVRWQHPTRGLIGPAEFLDVAEDGPLISEIGRWVLAQACYDTASGNDTEICVNVSPRQLAEPDFPAVIAQTLRDTGLDPGRLILEITETTILHASPAVLAATTAITELGVRFALDDFGTGHSSLSSLQKLPISYLKIDRSFTSQIGLSANTERLIIGILQLAASTGLSVVAEGVEELDQAAFLRGHGCLEAQGYLYGRPAPLLSAAA